ncbi:MAG: ABC transporter permease [Zavarzinella sp.]
MAIWTIARKDLKLLRRDYRSALILLLMPIFLVAILALVVGDGFGQKPDDRLRVTILNLDEGGGITSGNYPPKPWSEIVIDDLISSADIRLEIIHDREQAEELIREGKRSAILIFERDFSSQMQRCSFLSKTNPPPINPLYRDGINPNIVGLTILKDPTQLTSASIIEQVAQVTLFRVVIPWMIGNAFEKVGDPEFMAGLAKDLDGAEGVDPKLLKDLHPMMQRLLNQMFDNPKFKEILRKEFGLLAGAFLNQAPKLQIVLTKCFEDEDFVKELAKQVKYEDFLTPAVQNQMGPKVQDQIAVIFSNYNFRAKTWSSLTKNEPNSTPQGSVAEYQAPSALPKRGEIRFQILVPAYMVTFAFFLVLTVGWMFVGERRQNTLTRLRAAPISSSSILVGKLIPASMISVFQGVFLIVASGLLFGLNWTDHPLWMLAVVLSTSLAAVGISMLISVLAKTETQVAVYGTLVVLLLAGIGGSMMPRDLMPENIRKYTYVTPHAWALDAYQQLLTNPQPNFTVVAQACGVLCAFGIGALAIAAWRADFAKG